MTNIQNQKITVREVLAALGHGERITAAGSINVDLIVEIEQLPCPGETVVNGSLETLLGGKFANQAVICALLGTATSFIGVLGNDAHGDLLYQFLCRAGVDTAGISRVDQPNRSTLIIVNPHGENIIVYPAGTNATLSATSVAAQTEIIRGAQVLGLCPESPPETVAATATIVREAGVTMALNFSPITKAPDSLLRLVDVLIADEYELTALAGRPLDSGDTAGLWTALSDLGFERAVLTLGADGALVLEGGELVSVPPFAVAATDTIGCGDVFMGFLLAAVAAGGPLSRGACLASAVAGVAALRKGV